MNFHIPSCHRLLISLAFVLSAATGFPASAADQPTKDAPSITVKVGDLDLNTDAGRRELLDRLSKAASRACAEYANKDWPWAYAYPEIYQSCFRSSLAAAVEKIHHEQVSALFAATSRSITR